ncbi:MAG: hypothetical protein KBS70_08540 [Bacteroidales bacterium]|nr:hypothetical protein [Candidatus Colicola equi]
MNNATGAIDWDGYIEEYAAFINSHGIAKFFELDIDSIVGIKEVERLRAKLESKTGRRCIPVWHVSRGLDYFKRLVRDYDYIAIGGYVTKEIERAAYEKAFPFLIKTAHDNGCKIHGLGYTNLEGLKKYKFDSVDSTAWISGNRFGAVYKFDPKEGTMKKWNKPSGMRVKNMETAFNNFFEWVKFQQYLKLRR